MADTRQLRRDISEYLNAPESPELADPRQLRRDISEYLNAYESPELIERLPQESEFPPGLSRVIARDKLDKLQIPIEEIAARHTLSPSEMDEIAARHRIMAPFKPATETPATETPATETPATKQPLNRYPGPWQRVYGGAIGPTDAQGRPQYIRAESGAMKDMDWVSDTALASLNKPRAQAEAETKAREASVARRQATQLHNLALIDPRYARQAELAKLRSDLLNDQILIPPKGYKPGKTAKIKPGKIDPTAASMRSALEDAMAGPDPTPQQINNAKIAVNNITRHIEELPPMQQRDAMVAANIATMLGPVTSEAKKMPWVGFLFKPPKEWTPKSAAHAAKGVQALRNAVDRDLEELKLPNYSPIKMTKLYETLGMDKNELQSLLNLPFLDNVEESFKLIEGQGLNRNT